MPNTGDPTLPSNCNWKLRDRNVSYFSLFKINIVLGIVKFPFLSFFIISTFRLTNKAKTVVAVNQKCLIISVPAVNILPQLTKIHFTVINAGSAGKLGIYMVLVQ